MIHCTFSPSAGFVACSRGSGSERTDINFLASPLLNINEGDGGLEKPGCVQCASRPQRLPLAVEVIYFSSPGGPFTHTGRRGIFAPSRMIAGVVTVLLAMKKPKPLPQRSQVRQ